MSDADRRLRIVAIAFAATAMVVALTAAIVVVRRDAPSAAQTAPEKPAPPARLDRKVLSSDVIKLQHGTVETATQPAGIRINDVALATALGLETDDVITSMSGRRLVREMDVYDVVFNLSMMNATLIYVEIVRAGSPLLVRWELDGDLREARYANNGSPIPALPPPPLPALAPDPLLDTIEKIDDTHVRLPKATLEKLLADPMGTMKGARVVPAVRNGQPDGFKLYAIRPSSVFARLGLQNGDTVQKVNGTTVDTPDKALEVYSSLRGQKQVSLDLVRRGQPVSLTITITK